MGMRIYFFSLPLILKTENGICARMSRNNPLPVITAPLSPRKPTLHITALNNKNYL